MLSLGDAPGSDRLPAWLLEALVCPACHGDLDSVARQVVCRSCGTAFEQPASGALELLPGEDWMGEGGDWRQRLDATHQYFDELIDRREDAVRAIHSDYDPLAPLLAGFWGRIVDVGGGSGVARHFLSPEVEYLVVDPKATWLDPRWRALADVFPCLETAPPFVRGVAERLPLADGAFDCALMVSVLNHVSRPAEAVGELARVLKRGGRCLVVLEDVEPGWRDLGRGDYPCPGTRQKLEVVGRKLLGPLASRRLEADHIPISEADFRRWAGPRLALRHREWMGLESDGWWGAYLVHELERIG